MKKKLLTLFVLLGGFICRAQDTITISPIVGNVIDLVEKKEHHILPYYSLQLFNWAVFIRNADSSITLKSMLKLDSAVEKSINKEELAWIKNLIERNYSGLKQGNNAYDANIPKTTITGPVDTTKTFKIELLDGSIFIGNILHKDSVSVIMKTSSIPKIEIPTKNIKNIVYLDKTNLKYGEYWFSNPNATRYLFGPSAFNLKKREGYYQNTYLFLNSFNVGVTNNISIGGGIELFSTFATLTSGNFAPIFFVTPKVGFKVANKFHAGGGVLYASIPSFGLDSRSGLGIAYGIGTYGSVDHNVTGGLGWGFIKGKFSERPIITFSGLTRVSKKTALVTENWFVPSDNYYSVYSYGIRFFGENIAVDLAFINNADIFKVLFIGIPYVDFVVKF